MRFLKKIPPSCGDTPIKNDSLTYSEADLESELDFDSSALDVPPTPGPQLPRLERPVRNRRPPPRYGDFVPH